MIKGENISKKYGDLTVLNNVSISVDASEIVSITGPSGAGKSTLLQILGTLEKPSSGTLQYYNNDVASMNKRILSNFRNKNIGFIFQFHHLLPEFTAIENTCMPAFIAGAKKSVAEARAKKLLSDLGLSQRLQHKPNELSGGEQQRVAVARALMNEPEVVFADEPSGNLDSENANDLHQLFIDLRNEYKQSFVIVTHNLDLAKMADRTIKMKDGEILP